MAEVQTLCLGELLAVGDGWTKVAKPKSALKKNSEPHPPEIEWEEIDVCLDSGAVEWVTPVDTAPDLELEETEMSRQGMYYLDASGGEVPNYGQKRLIGETEDHVQVGCIMQVADVRKTPAGAIKITKAGKRIVLDEDGSYMENKVTGLRTKVENREDGFYFKLLRKMRPGYKKKESTAQGTPGIKITKGQYGALEAIEFEGATSSSSTGPTEAVFQGLEELL